jgi:hypothetical protein
MTDTAELIERAQHAGKAAGWGRLIKALAAALTAAEERARSAQEGWDVFAARFTGAEAALERERQERMHDAEHIAQLSDRLAAAEAREARLREAAMALYERVEMDESVGICLSSRVEALNLGAALAAGDAHD